MASNSFGNIFKITTWGESHGKAIGVIIDGCPSNLEINEDDINAELIKRAPGQHRHTSPRKEMDRCEVLAGTFEGKTTGAPISIIIWNRDADSSKYEPIKGLMRPGHANFTYIEKYGNFDWRGGGRASARETACRVAAGAVAKKILKKLKIEVKASLIQVGQHPCTMETLDPILEAIKAEGDSLGGIIEFQVANLPVGLGDPVYEKIDANLAKALMSIPASKGVEIGKGFAAATMKGSEHNDPFIEKDGKIITESNFAGGLLGGITSSMPLIGRVAFKPTSSIKVSQKTVDIEGKQETFHLPEGSRHDPCIAIRAVPVVEAMVALVITDAFLMNKSIKL